MLRLYDATGSMIMIDDGKVMLMKSMTLMKLRSSGSLLPLVYHGRPASSCNGNNALL